MVLNVVHVRSDVKGEENRSSESFVFISVRRTLHLGLSEEERAEVLGAGQKS